MLSKLIHDLEQFKFYVFIHEEIWILPSNIVQKMPYHDSKGPLPQKLPAYRFQPGEEVVKLTDLNLPITAITFYKTLPPIAHINKRF